MKRKSLQAIGLVSSAICSFAAVHAQAQAQGSPAPPDSAGGAQSNLQEIVVTAQRRSENLQNVPVAVTAISGSDIAAANIKSARELTVAVPGLVQSQAGGTPQTFLRGIGTTITSVNADPSVATYIDGVYQSLANVSSVKLADIQSVEVLKGPQGTLYGRNATGGAISITTRSPTDKFEASANATYGNFNRREFGGSVSGPLAEHLYAGIYGNYQAIDPYSKLLNLNGAARPNVRDHDFQWTTRAKLVYDNAALRIVLAGDINRYGSLQDMAYEQLQADASGYGSSTIGPRAVRNTDQYSFSTNIPVDNHWLSKGASLRVEYDLDWAKLVSITAYRDNSAYLRSDNDATEAVVSATDITLPNASRQTTQEVQVQSNNSGSVKWIVGGFYYLDEGRVSPFQITPPLLSQTIFTGVDTSSYSGYGQLDWSITPRWSVTVGGRYTDETKRYLGAVITTAIAPAGPTSTTLPRQSTHYSRFDPKLSLQYHLGDAMLYGSYSRAFKSGVYNVTASTVAGVGPVRPEELVAYEAGLKSELFDRRLRLNLSLFHYDYTNLQVQSVVGSSLQLQNAAKAHYDGADIDILWAVTSRLQLSAKMLIEDGKYDAFPAYAGYQSRNTAAGGNVLIPGGVNLTGRRTARTPEFTGTLGVSYQQPLSNGAQLAFSGLVYHSSSYAFIPDATLKNAPYTTVDASVEYAPLGRRWTASIWAKNLTNAFYANYMQVNANGSYRTPAAPRTVGATISLKFGGR